MKKYFIILVTILMLFMTVCSVYAEGTSEDFLTNLGNAIGSNYIKSNEMSKILEFVNGRNFVVVYDKTYGPNTFYIFVSDSNKLYICEEDDDEKDSVGIKSFNSSNELCEFSIYVMHRDTQNIKGYKDANYFSIADASQVYANEYNVLLLDGTITIYGAKDMSNSYLDIVMPFEDEFTMQTPLCTFWVSYKVPPSDADYWNFKISTSNNIKNKEIIEHTYDDDSGVGLLKFTLDPFPEGQTTVTVKLLGKNGEELSDSKIINKVSGFVDEDGDGKDDRTGDYQYVPSTPATDVDTSNTINNAIDSAKGLLSFFPKVSSLFAALLYGLPSPVRSGLFGIFGLFILLGIIRFIRG